VTGLAAADRRRDRGVAGDGERRLERLAAPSLKPPGFTFSCCDSRAVAVEGLDRNVIAGVVTMAMSKVVFTVEP